MKIPWQVIFRRSFFLTFKIHKQHELNLPADYPSLLLFDNFNGQCTETLLKMIDDKNINTGIIPANCTDRLQLLDLCVNKAVKTFLRKKVSGLVGRAEMIDLRLSIAKPLKAQWIVDVFNYIKTNTRVDIINKLIF